MNFITISRRERNVGKSTRGFERARITHSLELGALELGSNNLPELDQFAEFSPLINSNEMSNQSLPHEKYRMSFTNEKIDSDSDWEEDFDRSVFQDVIDFN